MFLIQLKNKASNPSKIIIIKKEWQVDYRHINKINNFIKLIKKTVKITLIMTITLNYLTHHSLH